MIWFWHWLVHVTGADYGMPYGHFSFYDLESGSGSDLGELAIVGALAAMIRHKNCHQHGCWRLGRFPVAGGQFVTCRRHHPDPAIQGGLRAHHILAAHQAAKAKPARRSS